MLEKPYKKATVTINCDVNWNEKSATEEKLKEERKEKEEIIAIECSKCGKLHKKNSNTYVTLKGGVHIGESGGILGRKEGNTYYCPECFKEEVADKIEHYYGDNHINCRCDYFSFNSFDKIAYGKRR